MITIHVTDRDGATRAISVEASGSLMQALKDEGLDVPAICGGCCSCATCHVVLEPDWAAKVGPATGGEAELLADNPGNHPGRSRLSCQVPLSPGLDGLRLTLGEIDG